MREPLEGTRRLAKKEDREVYSVANEDTKRRTWWLDTKIEDRRHEN